MKKIVLTGLLLCLMPYAQAATHVNGYYKSNGTYVQPHYRSDADSTTSNNWSVAPNVNPYTGKTGTKSSDYGSSPSSYSNDNSSSKANCYYNCQEND